MNERNPKVDDFINSAKLWQEELIVLRTLLLDCGLQEDIKWRQPCYTYHNKNVIIIGEFKEYCAMSFLKGVLLQDELKLLRAPGENSQSARIFRFTDVTEINELRDSIKAYIFEAVDIEKKGLKVEFTKSTALEFPSELTKIFSENNEFKVAFNALTPGRQRAYNMHFSSAKQSKTRETRISNSIPRILNGIGINDCTCGLSKKLPQCDGSHKLLKIKK